ncbi:hypothetical protein LWI29_019780 [Acer saccharum]|uniref:Uncharacterized protein n=1 Tax=Acer saccharum TaxID=4024 RepID=A0AA39SUK0_ACESA|nr:hypothetical protein LWI29_019780 [Acer saccharum]
MPSGDSSSVVQSQLDAVQARNDTSFITDEQTCALLQQKHMSLSEEFSKFESKQAQLQNSVDRCVQELELAQVQAKMHQIHLQSEHMSLSEDLSKLELSEESKHAQLLNSVDQRVQELAQVQADSSVAARAATIGDLHNNTSSITDEQTCALLEQKYMSLFKGFSQLESNHAQLQNSVDRCMQELAQLQSIGEDGEIERTSTEVSELHNTRRRLTGIDLYRSFLMYRNGIFGQEVNYGEYLQGFLLILAISGAKGKEQGATECM